MDIIQSKIYLGSRGDDFKKLIRDLLIKGRLKPKYIDKLMDKNGMNEYSKAFTASSANASNNYEIFEQLGDVSANKFIVWYAYKRFPQLDCTQGVKVVARLRINYGAKATFAPLAEKLGFWNFISAAEDGTDKGMKYKARNKKDLLEDTFEAFIGCTEYLLDKEYRVGVGYGIVFDILNHIFNDIPISLEFEDLFDPKTRLKETFDLNPQKLGSWVFIDSREENQHNEYTMAKSTLYQIPFNMGNKVPKNIDKPQYGWAIIGQGTGSTKSDAQQLAAKEGLEYLRRLGFYREPPPEYKYFCKT